VNEVKTGDSYYCLRLVVAVRLLLNRFASPLIDQLTYNYYKAVQTHYQLNLPPNT